jgi:cell division septation protein DedD
MGYIVGRSTVPAPVEAKKDPQHSPLTIDPTKPADNQTTESPNRPPMMSPGEVSLGSATARQTPSVSPEPAKAEPAAEPVKAAPVPPAEKKADVKKVAAKTETPQAAPAPVPAAAKTPAPSGPLFIEPAVGQKFIQVGAVSKAEAEVFVNVLRRAGFAAVMAAGPSDKEKLYRVLVGPLKDTAAVSKGRADLEAAGFKNQYVRNY